MDSNGKNVGVRSQESEVRRKVKWVQASTAVLRQARMPVLLVLLALAFSANLRAQAVNLGGACGTTPPGPTCLGKFINPTGVRSNSAGTVPAEANCGYAVLRIDLAQGKVFAIPNRTTNNNLCDPSPVDITNVVDGTTGQKPFAIAPTGPITDGVLEVTDFTLQRAFGNSSFLDDPFGFGSSITYLVFVPNANNTPVWIRATGNVTINGSTFFNVAGSAGANGSTFLRGAGGAGGPGGFRGGDGGNGGLFPSAGSSGFGPGGGLGGAIGANSLTGATFLTTNTTSGGTSIPAGNDLLTMERGGSGGGGGGGSTSAAARGGGGGGGAISIAANNTITVNGTIIANGADSTCCTGSGGTGGSGGAVRLVAATIAGSGTGTLSASPGSSGCTFSPCPGSTSATAGGIVRLEAFTITYTGGFGGGTNVAAASAPGQVILPTSPTVFLRVSKITGTQCGTPPVACQAGTFQSLDTTSTGPQAIPGRTGFINPVDTTMPTDPAGPIQTVTVDFVVGPNTSSPTQTALTGKTITLTVSPLDPAQPIPLPKTGTVGSCETPSPTAVCTASITGVTLPLGFSSMSAFTVLNISTGGALSRLFPRMFEGEEIENVRIQTDGKGTEYVLIAKSGREFPYQPRR